VDSSGEQIGRRAARAAAQAAQQQQHAADQHQRTQQPQGRYQQQQYVPAVAPAAAVPVAAPAAAAMAPPIPSPAPGPKPPVAAPTVAPTPRPSSESAAGDRKVPDRRFVEGGLDLTVVLERMLALGASDLHLAAGSPPLARVDGDLGMMEGFDELSGTGIQEAVYAILTQKQRERFETELELDLAYSLPGHCRFRVNVYRQREAIGAAFRRIPYEILSLEELGMPPSVARFANLARGMVLVTGPTGSGKSTTLASLVDLANRSRHDHILTVEDPIEFLHRHKSCLVNQREVGEDTHSFSNALRHALRQDPDILLVGEMRDLETIAVALTAAETGHLVFATLHTQDAAQTIDRVIDVFPPHQQQQVRTQLAGALQGVVSQTLVRTSSGRGRSVATEVLVATPAIRNLVREGKTHQIYSALQAGSQYGMHTLDQSLADLVRRRQVTREIGLEKCHHREDFLRLIGQG
jgi:twitching motility protein PilT